MTVTKIKKGFSNSIGCNLKKWKSNHLLAPLTSIPKIGTKVNEGDHVEVEGENIAKSKKIKNS